MVTKNEIRKCGSCTNGAAAIEKGYTLCHLKHALVWSNSVACNNYDDSVIF